ncbi:hypothetical protein D3C87_1538720 [compost metagenome]
MLDISLRDRIDEFRVLAAAVARVLGCLDGRLDDLEQAGQIAQLHIVDRPSYRAACGMPHDKHDLGAGGRAGEFHAAQ